MTFAGMVDDDLTQLYTETLKIWDAKTQAEQLELIGNADGCGYVFARWNIVMYTEILLHPR